MTEEEEEDGVEREVDKPRSRGFKLAIWPRYKSTSCLDVSSFVVKARWMSSMVASVMVNCQPSIALTKPERTSALFFFLRESALYCGL
jgi:hypothetical protein